jgi:hypothetical protein
MSYVGKCPRVAMIRVAKVRVANVLMPLQRCQFCLSFEKFAQHTLEQLLDWFCGNALKRNAANISQDDFVYFLDVKNLPITLLL